MATPYELAHNYKEWVATDEYNEAATRVLAQIKEQGIEAVYFVSPSIDGRPIGKMVTAELFERVVRRGIRLHPLAFTDFRLTLWGDPIGFLQEDAENQMVPDLTTFRQLPWQPRMARVLCYYYDVDSGDMLLHDPRGLLAKHDHTFRSETDATMFVGIEPELMWLRKKEGGVLEHTTDALAFYEIAYLEEFEPIMLDLLDYGAAMGLKITHADAEDKSQVEVNQAAQRRARLRRRLLDVSPDLPDRRPQARVDRDLHGQAVHGLLGQRPSPQSVVDERCRRERADRRPQG